jgi:hypothetical protein
MTQSAQTRPVGSIMKIIFSSSPSLRLRLLWRCKIDNFDAKTWTRIHKNSPYIAKLKEEEEERKNRKTI